jgi:hypothetical protein
MDHKSREIRLRRSRRSGEGRKASADYGRVSGGRTEAVVAQVVRQSEISMDIKTKIMALIEEGWDRNRPPGGVGTTDSATIYTRLLAEGVDVPPGAMARILEDLSAEGQITGPQAIDREGRQLHGARAIIEPEWRL